MARPKKEQPKVEAAPKAAPAKVAKKADKVVSVQRISDPNKVIDRSSFALVEGTLLKDHGQDKKGDVIKRHPNTMDMLRDNGIVK